GRRRPRSPSPRVLERRWRPLARGAAPRARSPYPRAHGGGQLGREQTPRRAGDTRTAPAGREGDAPRRRTAARRHARALARAARTPTGRSSAGRGEVSPRVLTRVRVTQTVPALLLRSAEPGPAGTPGTSRPGGCRRPAHARGFGPHNAGRPVAGRSPAARGH